MAIQLYKYQLDAVERLRTGSILCGGVGSGKSRTALAYFYLKVCNGGLQINSKGKYRKAEAPKDLYIITTAKKRDGLEWEGECVPFLFEKSGINLKVDSWNNIGKYVDVKDSFFIFDEQRVIGSGAWVKAFLKITKCNPWILLSATPGDTWMDYIPVFIANGFYKNRTEFIRSHVIYNRFAKFPKVDRYVGSGRLLKYRNTILVDMDYRRSTESHHENIYTKYDEKLFKYVEFSRWNIYDDKPIAGISEYCFILRRIVNSSDDRIKTFKNLIKENPRTIVFYNFNYELEILRDAASEVGVAYAEWNGQKHQNIPDSDKWTYFVQYNSGSEGWNCIKTNVMIFYSQSYSYKMMVQASGRIDRVNTLYSDLYYYHLMSNSKIDRAIAGSLRKKKNFNEMTSYMRKELESVEQSPCYGCPDRSLNYKNTNLNCHTVCEKYKKYAEKIQTIKSKKNEIDKREFDADAYLIYSNRTKVRK